jgi:hypothetical protein
MNKYNLIVTHLEELGSKLSPWNQMLTIEHYESWKKFLHGPKIVQIDPGSNRIRRDPGSKRIQIQHLYVCTLYLTLLSGKK